MLFFLGWSDIVIGVGDFLLHFTVFWSSTVIPTSNFTLDFFGITFFFNSPSRYTLVSSKNPKGFLKNGKKYVCEKKWAYKHFSHLLQWKLPQHCWHPTARLQQCNPSIHWSPPQGSAMSVSVLSSSIIIVEHSKKELGIETKLGTSKWQVTIKNYDWLTCILNQFRSHYQHNSHYRPY